MVNITDEDWKSSGYNVTSTAPPYHVYNMLPDQCSVKGTLCEDWKKRVVTLKDSDVLRPEHYGGKDNPYEVFNVLEAWELDKDFYLGNVIKYVARAGKKNKSTEKEDLQKALVYLQRRIDLL
jgi:hypothetical protein